MTKKKSTAERRTRPSEREIGLPPRDYQPSNPQKVSKVLGSQVPMIREVIEELPNFLLYQKK